MDYFIILYIIASSHFSQVIWSTIRYYVLFLKNNFSFGFNFKMCQRFIIIWASWWKSVVKRCYDGNAIHSLSFCFSFSVSCQEVEMALFI